MAIEVILLALILPYTSFALLRMLKALAPSSGVHPQRQREQPTPLQTI